MIKILLIDCSRALEVEFREVFDFDAVHHPPVGLMALATQITKSDIGKHTDIKIIDSTVDYTSIEELEQLIIDSDPDIVGLRTLHKYTEQFHQASSMAKKLPKLGIQFNTPIVISAMSKSVSVSGGKIRGCWSGCYLKL